MGGVGKRRGWQEREATAASAGLQCLRGTYTVAGDFCADSSSVQLCHLFPTGQSHPATGSYTPRIKQAYGRLGGRPAGISLGP